jgi:carboxymethylenebutenolidase
MLVSGSLALAGLAPEAGIAAGTAAPPYKRVTFQSDGNALVGYLYQPEGLGPWPALIWNHGSEENPAVGRQFDTVASYFVPAGYAVFAPVRRGHGESEGKYVVDRIKRTFKLQGREEGLRQTVRLLDSEQLADQLAGLAFVKGLSIVDPERIVVAGCSYGGIQALLGAESGAGYKAAISLSPAALSWEQNIYLQIRLTEAVRRIHIPVLLVQPAKDASLAPSRILGAEAKRARTPLTVKVYPAAGPAEEQSHCFGGASGMHVWADDAKAFFQANLP